MRHKAHASQPHTPARTAGGLPSPTSQYSIQSLSKSVSALPHGRKKEKARAHNNGYTAWWQ